MSTTMNRRRRWLPLAGGCAVLCLIASPALAERYLLSTSGSERATSGGNLIVTHEGRTHVVWQDRQGDRYLGRARTFDHATGELSPVYTLAAGRDNHARPTITIDSHGYLHVILGGHHTPFQYLRSTRPNDASSWTEPRPLAKSTYPVVVCAPDDSLYLTGRHDQNWLGVDFSRRPAAGNWQRSSLLVKKAPRWNGYAGYANGLVCDRQGGLHLVCDFYEGRDTWKSRGNHQAVCYMKSLDGGESWQRADGQSVKLPARPEGMDTLARDTGDRHEPLPPPELLSQGNIVVDSGDVPYVLYLSHREQPGAVILATPDKQGRWRQRVVEELQRAYPDHRPIECRGRFTIGADDTLYALLNLVPLGAGWKDGKPTRALRFNAQEPGRLVWLISRNQGQSFTVMPASLDGQVVHEANLERPVGSNQIPAGSKPAWVYFDGLSRYPKRGEVIENNVYLVLEGD